MLLDEHLPHGAFRFYAKLRALAWGEATLSINFEDLMRLTGLSQTRVYEYARLLRDRNGLLFHCAQGAFECSFPDLAQIPVKREKPSLLISDAQTSENNGQKPKPAPSRIAGKRESGIGAGTAAIKDEYVRLLGFKPDTWAEGEAVAAKKIGEKYTVEQFSAAYNHYKSQKFWGDKRLSLRWLVGQIPEYLAFRHREANNGSNRSKRSDPPGGREAEPLSEAQRIARRLSAGGNMEDDHGSPRAGS